ALVSSACHNDLCDPALYTDDGGVDSRCLYDGGADAPDDAPDDAPLSSCEGTCVTGPPPGWSFPDLVWIGPTDGTFSCPPEAPVNGFDGHADLMAPDP